MLNAIQSAAVAATMAIRTEARTSAGEYVVCAGRRIAAIPV